MLEDPVTRLRSRWTELPSMSCAAGIERPAVEALPRLRITKSVAASVIVSRIICGAGAGEARGAAQPMTVAGRSNATAIALCLLGIGLSPLA